MNEDGSSRLKKKKFSSLSRSKIKHRVGSSPIPINNLTGPDDRNIHTSDTQSLFTNTYSPNEAIKKSEKLRSQLEHEIPASPTKKGSSYSFIDNEMEYVKDVSGSKVLTHSIIRANSKLQIDISSVDRNGNVFKSDGNRSIRMYIPIAGNYIVFSKGQSIIDKLVVHETQVESIKFGDHRILVELKNRQGYVYVIYKYDDSNLWDFFQSKRWLVEKQRYNNEDLIQERKDILTRRYSTIYEPSKIERKCIKEQQPKEISSIISPSHMYEKRKTRSETNYLIESDTSVDDDQVLEKPASFEPPLKHSFSDKKTFTINYSDFKTLYNNEWINDSIIDFFIKYEVENAVQNLNIKSESIYAFNSFFFNKMMEKNTNQDEYDPYKNVKRWLNKVDLMSYSYVIIPINEYAHWYCCIIRGLPELLQKANDDKANIINLTNSISSLETTDIDDIETSNFGEEPEDVNNEGGSTTPQSKKKGKSTKAEIFVFDSLSQKHSNIHIPLKRVLIDYCKDKFGVELQKDQIRVQNAKVPKQNNFNDCGIHVIYNIRKWLSNISECERLWRSSQSRYAARSFFIAEERNKMRRELIDLLLSLHKEQMKRPDSVTPQPYPDESDDEIEVIEYVPKEKNEKSDFIKNEIEFNFQNNPINDPVAEQAQLKKQPKEPPKESPRSSSTHLRTLDPKAIQNLNTTKKPKHIFTNDSLNDILSNKPITNSVVQFLNSSFSKKNYKLDDEEKNMIYELVEYTNLLDETSEQDEINHRIKRFEEKYKKAINESETSRPKNQKFRIDHEVGITKTVDISESDIMYDDLTNLNLSDNSSLSENLESKHDSKSNEKEVQPIKTYNSRPESKDSISLLDKLNKNPFKKRKVV